MLRFAQHDKEANASQQELVWETKEGRRIAAEQAIQNVAEIAYACKAAEADLSFAISTRTVTGLPPNEMGANSAPRKV